MLVEVLQQVQKAEEKAQKIRNEAVLEARDIAKGIETANIEHEKQSVKDHRQLLQHLLEERRQLVEKKLKSQAPEKKQNQETLLVSAQQNMTKAVDLIAERIMKHGNC